MKIIIDDKIPYIRGAFDGKAEVIYLSGAKTTPETVRNADALITRTRTVCNENLLAGSAVRFIATATIGYDHIDTAYCARTGICWTNAPGCNSKSVEQYIASALMVMAERKGWRLAKKTIGIVGVGNVGSKVERIARILGMKILLNDPPRERSEGTEKFVSLKRIMNEADIITLHVPLEKNGEDATWHLADKTFFDNLKRAPLLINACRGEVCKTEDVKYALINGQISDFVCDCWEGEPNIDLELLAMTAIATPHIAGYSKDGKAMGTTMSVQALSRFFGLELDNWQAQDVELPEKPEFELDGNSLTEQQILAKAILHTYDICKDDADLKNNPESFEKLRGDYPVRREFPSYFVYTANILPHIINKLDDLGFTVMTEQE